MGTESAPAARPAALADPSPRWCGPAVVLAALAGLGLMLDALPRSSATYDEVTYLQTAAHWWRTGDQAEISRMGSPLLFWKLQQAPVLWLLDHTNRRAWIDDPIAHQAVLLPYLRMATLWIWVAALALIATWSRLLYGPRAMAAAAWLFALSPNLLAHGPLLTMEFPLLASTTATCLLFWRFLQTADRRWFWGSALVCGVAWSCKFTTVLLPPMLAVVWWLERTIRGERPWFPCALEVGRSMLVFAAVMGITNVVVTGFAMLPLSQTRGIHPELERRMPAALRPLAVRAVETPIPQDLVGFANQILQQRGGGLSYLFGQRRETGWWYYYFVAMAVKVPLTFWLLVAGRILLRRSVASSGNDLMLPAIVAMFLVVTAVASTRNFGIRYLFPLAPLAIVWVSGLAQRPWHTRESRRCNWAAGLVAIAIVGQGAAVACSHPHEITYFNALAGGPLGGRRILADSNLDWSQGLRSLARLQRRRPEYRDLTFYYFGNTGPSHYGVAGTCHVLTAIANSPTLPSRLSSETPYFAVSTSLTWGPWGPDGYFRELRRQNIVAMTDDHTIAIYRTADLRPNVARGTIAESGVERDRRSRAD
jgi:hypothetical protein